VFDHPLGAWNLPRQLRIMPDRLIESAGQGFEESFGAVMVIFSGQQAGM
jgi:hypothetical protein